MLIPNTLSPSVKTNRKLSKSRSNIYSKKADFYQSHSNPTTEEPAELKVLTEEERAALHEQLRKEIRSRYTGHFIMALASVVSVFLVIKYFMF